MVEVLMQADKMLLARKHPRIDKVLGKITGFKIGKVKPGEQFMWRGDALAQAPSAAHAVDASVQEEIVEAKAALRRQRALEVEMKKAEGAALAAQAAAAVFRGANLYPAIDEPAEPAAPPPKRRGRPPGTKNKPKEASDGPEAADASEAS